MPEDEIAIRVENVSKDFVLPHEKVTTLKGLFTSIPKRHKKTRESLHALQDVSLEIKKGEFFGIVAGTAAARVPCLKCSPAYTSRQKGK